jgi:C-terminal processing protease CtpA/Prc
MAAMNFLADSDALIVDLRDNRGGAPQMAALLSSYLFDERTHLDDIYDRRQNSTEQVWTFPHLPGKKLTGKPLFVLTSTRTFSAGEQFSYDLKVLKRATLIGETRAGALISCRRTGSTIISSFECRSGASSTPSRRRIGRARESSPT